MVEFRNPEVRRRIGFVKRRESKFNFEHVEFKLFRRHSRNICEVLGKFSKSFIFTEKSMSGL